MRRFAFLLASVAAACSKFGSEGAPAEDAPVDGGVPPGQTDDASEGTTDGARPTDGGAEPSARIVFVTTQTYDGFLGLGPVSAGGVSDICSSLADKPLLQGHGPWALVIVRRDDSDPLARLPATTWISTNGDVVFTGRPSKDAVPFTPILTEEGARLAEDAPVWTGVGNGIEAQTCNDWPDESVFGVGSGGVGFATPRTTDKVHGWWASDTRDCVQPSDPTHGNDPHVYCFEVDKL